MAGHAHVIVLSSESSKSYYSSSSDSYHSSSSDNEDINTLDNPIRIDGGDGGNEHLKELATTHVIRIVVSSLLMKKSFVEDDCSLLFQFKHASKFLRGFNDRSITLYVGNQPPWSVLVKHSNEQYRLGRGWRAFVEANRLQKNDVCLFHLLPDGGVYDIKIFKA